MVELATKNANAADLSNISFTEVPTASIPLPDSSVDCIFSNCVVNLVPTENQPSVFVDIARLLKPGRRLAISGILAKKKLPRSIVDDMALYVGCISGASQVAEYEEYLARAGFTDGLIVDAKADLNLYKQSSYLAQPAAGSSCCGPAGSAMKSTAKFADIDFNDWVGSFQVYAVKPGNT